MIVCWLRVGMHFVEINGKGDGMETLGRVCRWINVLAFLAVIGSGISIAQGLSSTNIDGFQGKPRMIVISDIGNEPDDQMSLVRLLLYSNELDIEGLIASTSTWQKTAIHPETMRKLIEAYRTGAAKPDAERKGLA